MRFASWLVALLIACTVPFAPATAHAQDANEPSKAELDEARDRYQRGRALYNDGAYEQALIEFERAYKLAPAFRILYNIGTVAMIVKDYPKAIRALNKYLEDGGDKIDEDRTKAVKKDLETLNQRVAFISVTTNVEGALVVVDDDPVGEAPLSEPIMVNAGRHVVVARKAGYIEATQTVTLAGKDETDIQLDLVKPGGGGTSIIVTPPRPGEPMPETPGTVEPEEDYTWIGWVVTGTLTAGAVVTGIAALSARSDLDSLIETPGTTREQLDDKETERFALGLTTDILAGSAAVAGGVTLIFAILNATGDEEVEPGADEGADTGFLRDVKVSAGPTSIVVQGSF